jgi:hypothetical protein
MVEGRGRASSLGPMHWEVWEACLSSSSASSPNPMPPKAEKRARQRAKEKERKDGAQERKAEAAAAAKAAMEDEIARAAAEAAAMSLRCGPGARERAPVLVEQGARARPARLAMQPFACLHGMPAGRRDLSACVRMCALILVLALPKLLIPHPRLAHPYGIHPPVPSPSRATAPRGGRQVRGGAARGQAAAPASAEDQARRREQLAAAAEARLKTLQQAQQRQQLWSVAVRARATDCAHRGVDNPPALGFSTRALACISWRFTSDITPAKACLTPPPLPPSRPLHSPRRR